jgi:thymidylate synthase (FAD)
MIEPKIITIRGVDQMTRHPELKVLDHGYIRLIETWGRGDAEEPEAGIIEAARQSTQGSFRGWETEEKLLATLFNHKPPHATPFEFAGMVIEVQAPIMVFREWHRHRTQSYNEMSARYAPLPDLNYIPTVERVMADLLNPSKNKQQQAVKDSVQLTHEYAETFRDQLRHRYADDEIMYQWALKHGVPKELARLHLPVGRYSRMRASTCLRNWLGFLTLRFHPDAQWEIRQYAEAMATILEVEFPRTFNLFTYGHVNGNH